MTARFSLILPGLVLWDRIRIGAGSNLVDFRGDTPWRWLQGSLNRWFICAFYEYEWSEFLQSALPKVPDS